jgi:hypothetical protein
MKEQPMQASGTALVDAMPAVTLTAIAAEVLKTQLPQPDHVSLHPGPAASVSFQFSQYMGAERFGYVREWADSYGVPVVQMGRFHQAVFTYLGVEFTVFAPEKKDDGQ